MYKPGQLVTIKRHVYRITKRTVHYRRKICFDGKTIISEIFFPCFEECQAKNNFGICERYCTRRTCNKKIPKDCCFKLIK